MSTGTGQRRRLWLGVAVVTAALIAAPGVAVAATAGAGTPPATAGAGTPTATATASPATASPAAASASPSTAPTGELTLTNPDAKAGDDLVFSYRTDHIGAKNWIGVYDTPADGPTDERYHAPSTAYAYTGEHGSGTLTVSGAKLTAGHPISAYLLADDGYSWLAAPISFTLAAATTPPPSPRGTLQLDTENPTVGDSLTFSWSTSTPNSLNWIGLYNDPSRAPYDQKSHGASTTWTYVSGTSGTATLPSGALSSGHDIAAYLLYDDGYTWLATPITFSLKEPPPYDPTPTTAHFVTDDVTEGASAPNTRVRATVSGLWFGADGGAPTSPVSFQKTAGSSWLRVSTSGVVTGTTPATATPSSDPGTIQITATDAAGVTGTIVVEFPLVPRNTRPVLKSATLSMWDAGTHVTRPREKLVASILRNRLDAVGLQETGGHEGAAVAALLGWNRVETASGVAVISRYPLSAVVAPKGLPGVSARADVDGHGVRLWSIALDDDDFGPAVACSGYRGDVVAREKASLRYQQASALAAAVSSARATGIPDVVLGSLNSPAAADWTRATAAQHCGHAPLAWPVPEAFAKAGLTDSFRSAQPNPARSPGATQLFAPEATPTSDGAERLDYVDYSGRLSVVESHVLVDGFPSAPPATGGNSWISDRAAVVTTFTIGASPR